MILSNKQIKGLEDSVFTIKNMLLKNQSTTSFIAFIKNQKNSEFKHYVLFTINKAIREHESMIKNMKSLSQRERVRRAKKKIANTKFRASRFTNNSFKMGLKSGSIINIAKSNRV